MSNFFDKIAPHYDAIPCLLRINYPLVDEMTVKAENHILDVGGGNGRLAHEIVDTTGARVSIIDSSKKMLNQVKDHPRIEVICGSIVKNDFQDCNFDIITCVDTIHHLKNPQAALEEMYRILKPGGKIFIQDFNSLRIRTKLLKLVEKHLLAEPANFYSPKELEEVSKKVGFLGESKSILKIQYLYKGKKYE